MLPINQIGAVTAVAEDAAGNPTNEGFTSIPAWSVNDPALASVVPAANGLSAILTPLKAGTVVVSVSGSVASNPSPISGSLSVDITDISTQIGLSLVAQAAPLAAK